MYFLQSEEEKDTKTKFDAQDVLQSDEAVAPVETDGSTSALFDLCLRAAKSLNVTWPAPPPRQQQTRLVGSYFLPKQQAAVRHKMPVFPDFLTELTRSWSTPKAPLSLPLSQFLDVEGMEQAGLSHMPPMDETLAAHLAPPSKHCRFSALQLEKIYRAQCHAARALNTASMLQAYQAERLQDLQESAAPKGKITESVEEARRTADLVLRLTGTAAVALGKSMAEAVVAQRHLWLTLTELPESQRAAFLHQAVEPTGLFGGAPLEKIQNLCDLRCKQETSKLEKQSSMPESDYDNTFHDSETDDLGTGRLKSSSWLGEGSSVPELDDVEMESDPTLPSTEDVIRKTEQITKNIQELLRAAQDNKRDSFIPCSERIQVAVTEMAALFPKKPRSETVRNSLHLLTFSASRLQNECRKAVPSEVCSSGPDMQLVTQQVIQCAFDIAKAAKQLVTITTKENAN